MTAMKINQQEIIAYLLHELSPERQEQVGYLIRQDEEWKMEFEKWALVMENLSSDKKSARSFDDIPNRYWSTFLPRVRERIDTKEQKRHIFRVRFIQAVPSFGLAVLILFFMNNVLITNQKIDYLLDQYNWMRSLNSSEIIDQYIGENVSVADKFINEVLGTDDDENTALTDWEGAYNPTESVLLDDNGLTPEEQKELLQNLEKTTTF